MSPYAFCSLFLIQLRYHKFVLLLIIATLCFTRSCTTPLKSSITIFCDFEPGISIKTMYPPNQTCEFPKSSPILYVRFVSTKVPHKMSFSFRAMDKHTFTKYCSLLNPADLCLYLYLSSCVTCCVSLATLCIKYTTNIPRCTVHIPTVIYSY